MKDDIATRLGVKDFALAEAMRHAYAEGFRAGIEAAAERVKELGGGPLNQVPAGAVVSAIRALAPESR